LRYLRLACVNICLVYLIHMFIARTVGEMREYRRGLHGRAAFIPTLGALHAGHISLITGARKLADHVLVSIFLNPTQFGPGEDYETYPWDLNTDLDKCREASVAGVFCPSLDQMYPPGQVACEVRVPQLGNVLEGKMRPGFFTGVCRVVAKLFNIVQPDIACFGKKDYQQARVVEAMVADLAMPLGIELFATVREADGLACSSRNAYLKGPGRKQATCLFKALAGAKLLVEEGGEVDPSVVESAMLRRLAAHQAKVDYAVVRHPQTLAPLDCLEPALTDGVVALVAARVAGVRLIDNMEIGVA